MRLLTDKKGMVRIIEALFASILILSCLALIPAQAPHRNSTSNLLWKAENVLMTLDSDGHIASLIKNQDWVALKNSVESSLPLTTWFNLTVYDQNGFILNPYPISNGGAPSANIASFNYVCVSTNSTFAIYYLQLQLAVVS